MKNQNLMNTSKKEMYYTPKIEKLGNMVKITKDSSNGSKCDNSQNTSGSKPC